MVAAPPPAKPVDAQALVAVAADLAVLLERETKLVRAMQIAAIAPLQEEKLRLIQLFAKTLKSQGGNDGIRALAGPAKLKWLAAGKRLAEAAIENERALRIGRTATERLIGAVVTAVKKTSRPAVAYSTRRAAPTPPRLAGIALDRQL